MKTKRWTEKRGYQVVRQWERSGLSMAAFARARGYEAQRLRYWREAGASGGGAKADCGGGRDEARAGGGNQYG